MLRRAITLSLSISLVALPCPAQAELAKIWALGESTKVKPDDLNHPLAQSNTLFDGRTLKLFGMRNEVLGFQLIVVGGAQLTKNVSVTLSNLGPIKNGTLSKDPDRYYMGRLIEIFEQWYLPITHSSYVGLPLRAMAAKPPAHVLTGEIPDPLIPHRNPITIRARRNQGFWVDIYIPKGTPPGVHRGVIEVNIGGEPCDQPGCRMPIELSVLPHTMPDRPTLKTMVYFSGGETDRDAMPARYFENPLKVPREAMDRLRARHFKMGRRHRITFIIGTANTPDGPLRQRLNGSAFSAESGYEGPGANQPQDVYSILTYGMDTLTPARVKIWNDFLAPWASDLEFFYYAYDEPHSPQDWARVSRRARLAKPLPSFITSAYRPDSGATIFCAPVERYRPDQGEKAKQAGHRLWIYHGVRPYSGTFFVDEVGAALRVNAWIQFKHRIPRWFYWEATYYKDFQGGRGHYDLFADALTFTNKGGDKLSGDGVLVYPGRDFFFHNRDRGIDHPLPSIRLKNWRRGIQDAEYLALLIKEGQGDFARHMMALMVPQSVEGSLRPVDHVSWPEDGESWERAHRLLHRALKDGRSPTIMAKRLARPAPTLMTGAKHALARAIDPLVRSPRRLAATLMALGLAMVGVAMAYRRRQKRRP